MEIFSTEVNGCIKYGIRDKKKQNILVEPTFDFIDEKPDKAGYIAASKDKKWGFINTSGT
jgi:hypothetical protein